MSFIKHVVYIACLIIQHDLCYSKDEISCVIAYSYTSLLYFFDNSERRIHSHKASYIREKQRLLCKPIIISYIIYAIYSTNNRACISAVDIYKYAIFAFFEQRRTWETFAGATECKQPRLFNSKKNVYLRQHLKKINSV